ncbi:MAG: hypothetical protein ACLR7P_12665 [Faecalibacterium sp.]
MAFTVKMHFFDGTFLVKKCLERPAGRHKHESYKIKMPPTAFNSVSGILPILLSDAQT